MGEASGEPFRVARIDKTHGLKGDVSAAVLTDFPERFADLSHVRVGAGPGAERRRLLSARLHKRKVILRFEGFDDINAAQALVGCDVWIEADEAMELPDDTYYHRDLIGMAVLDRDGNPVGDVRDVLLTGGTDVLVVGTAGGEVLIPAAKEICVEIDLEARRLVVDPPEGLLEINAV